jgi:hypothetical protein
MKRSVNEALGATVSAAGSCEGHEGAFQKTLRDPELIAEAERSKLNISPISRRRTA